jgi:8-oxo-dGTP pyrophosphatase MutT (NUDIX family)
LLRFVAGLIIKKDSDEAQRRAIKIRDYYIGRLGQHSGVNAFQWCKARLVLEKHVEAVQSVLRFEADSKFFRSFAVVIAILVGLNVAQPHHLVALGGIFFLALSLWRYIDQRLKTVNQAYWYVLTLEAGAPNGYRGGESQQKPEPSRAGGVVYRRKRNAAEYLVVEAKETPGEWVLPKGHIEPEEAMTQTAVREVAEETGCWARIDGALGVISFESRGEEVAVQFYLMEGLGRDRPEEQRRILWLPLSAAIERVAHEESRRLLSLADERLRSRAEGG